MSSIIGHAMAGIAIGSAFGADPAKENKGRIIAAAALLAALPDLDVVAYIAFGSLGIAPHRGVTHTILFAVIVSAIAAAAGSRYLRLTLLRTFVLALVILLSHLALDYLMGCGPALQLLWPFSNTGYLFPYRVVPTAFYALSGPSLASLLIHPLTLIGILFETIIFLPLILLSNRRPNSLPVWGLVSLSVLGLLASIIFYNRFHP